MQALLHEAVDEKVIAEEVVHLVVPRCMAASAWTARFVQHGSPCQRHGVSAVAILPRMECAASARGPKWGSACQGGHGDGQCGPKLVDLLGQCL